MRIPITALVIIVNVLSCTILFDGLDVVNALTLTDKKDYQSLTEIIPTPQYQGTQNQGLPKHNHYFNTWADTNNTTDVLSVLEQRARLTWLLLLLKAPLVMPSTNVTEVTSIEDRPIDVVFFATGGALPYRWLVSNGMLPEGISLDEATGTLSGTPAVSGTFLITVQVIDSSGDSIAFDVTITIYSKFVVVENGQFKLHGKNWYPYGVNYYPHYAVNPQPDFPFPQPDHWLGSSYYDEAAVENDLIALELLGVNCISTRASTTSDTWPALLDFLSRCLKHNIRVFLSLPEANPLKPELDNYDAETAIDELISTLKLDENEAIFAYDIAYEPNLGAWGTNDGSSPIPYLDLRSRYDGLWSSFIEKEYGGISIAETAFGRGLDTSRTGQAVGIISHSLPTRAVAGVTYSSTITLKNMGTTSWTNDDPAGKNHYLAAVLGDSSFPGWSVVPDDTVTPISEDILPGEEVSFSVFYTAPATSGRQRIILSMVQNYVAWFGSLLDWQVEVVPSGGVAVQKTINYPSPVLGPSDNELESETPSALASVFRRFLDTHVATRFGHVTRHIRGVDPNHLISCRQGWGGNGSSNHIKYYPLDLYSTAYHFDFLGPENYEFMYDTVSDTILSGSATTAAYSRWANNGKPVLWTESAYNSMVNPNAAHNLQQTTYYDLFIQHMLTTGANGVLFWWWPGGTRSDEGTDFGITDENGILRPAAFTLKNRSAEATADRDTTQTAEIGTVDLLSSPRGYESIYKSHRPAVLAAYQSGRRYVMQGDGEGSTSAKTPQTFAGLPKHLWADMSLVEIRIGSGDWFEVRDGYGYVIPVNTQIEARATVINMGDTSWVTEGSGGAGIVYFSGNENYGLQFRTAITSTTNRMEPATIEPVVISSGIHTDAVVQFQMLADQVSWMSGSLRIYLFPL